MNIRPGTLAFINGIQISPWLNIAFQFIAILTQIEPRYIFLTLFFDFFPQVCALHYYFIERNRVYGRNL